MRIRVSNGGGASRRGIAIHAASFPDLALPRGWTGVSVRRYDDRVVPTEDPQPAPAGAIAGDEAAGR
jgi:hypothetical protein